MRLRQHLIAFTLLACGVLAWSAIAGQAPEDAPVVTAEETMLGEEAGSAVPAERPLDAPDAGLEALLMFSPEEDLRQTTTIIIDGNCNGGIDCADQCECDRADCELPCRANCTTAECLRDCFRDCRPGYHQCIRSCPY